MGQGAIMRKISTHEGGPFGGTLVDFLSTPEHRGAQVTVDREEGKVVINVKIMRGDDIYDEHNVEYRLSAFCAPPEWEAEDTDHAEWVGGGGRRE